MVARAGATILSFARSAWSPDALAAAQGWLERERSRWETRLDQLDSSSSHWPRSGERSHADGKGSQSYQHWYKWMLIFDTMTGQIQFCSDQWH
jgi:hypothetical protein